jgi:hypothetical protein
MAQRRRLFGFAATRDGPRSYKRSLDLALGCLHMSQELPHLWSCMGRCHQHSRQYLHRRVAENKQHKPAGVKRGWPAAWSARQQLQATHRWSTMRRNTSITRNMHVCIKLHFLTCFAAITLPPHRAGAFACRAAAVDTPAIAVVCHKNAVICKSSKHSKHNLRGSATRRSYQYLRPTATVLVAFCSVHCYCRVVFTYVPCLIAAPDAPAGVIQVFCTCWLVQHCR